MNTPKQYLEDSAPIVRKEDPLTEYEKARLERLSLPGYPGPDVKVSEEEE
jgi:hypothetical protein